MAVPETNGDIEEISGIVESVVFRNDDTGYTVCQVNVEKASSFITVVGVCAAIWPGETLRAFGRWTVHKTHGRQFNAERIICIEPYSVEGIEKYLAYGVNGIGPVFAARLVKTFGADTLRVIEEESALLTRVEGIGKKRKEEIKKAWNEQKAVREIMIFLHSQGISASQAMRIYKQYGDDAVAIVKKNPYRLAADVWGIGFKSADEIAVHMGIPLDSEVRARAGIIYALDTLTEEGHCFCPKPELVDIAERLLEIPAEKLEQALLAEIHEGTLVNENDNIYPARLYHSETETVSHIHRLFITPTRFKPVLADKAVQWAGEKIGISFAERQHEALCMALTSKVSIITGGPGVGKTTIVRALTEIFKARKLKTLLAAPTGRAAKRLEEATGRPASTIHRLLRFQPASRSFEFNRSNPLDCDIIILDEVSMMDIALAALFLRAVPDHACLILVGDADQLPSVGPGNFLKDLLESETVPSVKLDRIFRQGERSWIVHNAHLVNTGRFFELPENAGDSDFFFVEADDPDKTIQLAVELVANRIPKRFNLNPMTDIQVLTPMRRFQLGAENLNIMLQNTLNPTGPSISRFGRTFRVRDRVMQLRNNYDKEVFNGDIGTIASINLEDQTVNIRFDNKVVNFELAELDEIMLAYATSIHKAQGSEHPAVVVVLAMQHFRLLQRNLLYTAITRGRRLVCLVGSTKAAKAAIRNNNILLRKTGLKQRLAKLNIPWQVMKQ